MSLESAACVNRLPVDQPAGLGWLLLIPLGCLLLGQALLASTGLVSALDGGLADPDSYMRLNRVLHLYESGNWFDPTYPRINPPDGHVQHWTRPLDALLLAGAWLLEPFLGFRDGLHVWGVLLSPVCLALTILALNWAATPALDRNVRLIACLLLLLQPTAIAYSSLGRPDHHAPILLLFVLLLGCTVRLLSGPDDRRIPMAGGAVAALAVWISPEALVFVGTSLAVLGLYWLAGDPAIARRCRVVVGWTVAFLALGLLLERGPGDLLAVENDRLSVLHVVLFALIALFWAAIEPLQKSVRLAPGHRLMAAAAGVVVLVIAMLGLFPDLRAGPLGEVDPLYRELRLERIVEIQPLISMERLAAGQYGALLGRAIAILGIALLAIPYVIWRLFGSDGERQRFWAVIAIGLLAFLPLAVHQIRWASYAQILLVIPYAALLYDLLARLLCRTPIRWVQIVRPGAIVLALFWPMLASAALPRIEPVTANDACSIAKLAPELDRLAGARPKTVLTLADFGSELLYRTPHAVLSIPNHRPQPGYGATHRVLTTTDPDAARRVLDRHAVDWILLCPGAMTGLLGPEREEPTLYRRLVEGGVPAWLHRLDLPPPHGQEALLYELAGPDAARPSQGEDR